MLKRVIDWSVRNPLVVLLFAVVAIVAGIVSIRRTPLEALPDLSDVQVIVQADYNEQARGSWRIRSRTRSQPKC